MSMQFHNRGVCAVANAMGVAVCATTASFVWQWISVASVPRLPSLFWAVGGATLAFHSNNWSGVGLHTHCEGSRRWMARTRPIGLPIPPRTLYWLCYVRPRHLACRNKTGHCVLATLLGGLVSPSFAVTHGPVRCRYFVCHGGDRYACLPFSPPARPFSPWP